MYTNKIEKEKNSRSKQNEMPLKSIVIYHGTNQGGYMELNKRCPNIKSKKSSNMFFNQRYVQQTSLLGIDSLKKIVPKEWFNHSNEIDHPFRNKLKLAKNGAIQRVLEYHNQEYKDNKLEKLGIEVGLISDPDDSSKSVYSDATYPYYLPTEAELFKVLNIIIEIQYGILHYNGLGLTKIINMKNIRCFVLVEDLVKNGLKKKDL